jgi:antitoxin (DNA-binding transcriptional repressor) of toxin-antitoxin stability system
MRAVGLKVLKNRLSEYVRMAANGETILVTDRDRVVAELIAPRDGRSPIIHDALLAEAVRKGWLVAPRIRSETPPARLPVTAWSELACEIDRDRDDR